ncbi:MAG: hypothetical protein WKF71_03270 [Pyrinomonadaceae bacterium]
MLSRIATFRQWKQRSLQKIARKSGVAASITPDLADLFTKDFEKGMAEFYSTRETELPKFLCEMSVYFSKFMPLEGNLYKELIKFVANTKHQVVFATTNYDLLIEFSIFQLGYKVQYQRLPVNRNSFSVLKIHGSCNFLPDLMGNKITGNTFQNVGVYIDFPVRFAQPYEIINFCKEEKPQAPAIAMYAKGKEVKFCNKFVLEQRQFWLESVSKAKRIFVVGLKINADDSHIWQVLASSKAKLLYFGFSKEDEEDFDEWKKQNSRKNAQCIKGGFVTAIPIIKSHLKQ